MATHGLGPQDPDAKCLILNDDHGVEGKKGVRFVHDTLEYTCERCGNIFAEAHPMQRGDGTCGFNPFPFED